MKRLSPGHVAVIAIVAARLIASALPGMWLWGLDAERFLPRPAAWAAWSVLVIACLPSVLTRIVPGVEWLGERLARSLGWRIGMALLLGAVVLALDDRTWFTGDFLIRHGGLSAEHIAYTQAMSLELILFETLPRLTHAALPAGVIHRALGAVAAFGIGIASLELARTWTRRGLHLVAVACILCFGGYLAVCTGLGKPSALLCMLTVVSAALAFGGIEEPAPGKGSAARRDDHRTVPVALAVTVSVAMILHRAGALLLPCWAVALHVAVSRSRPGARAPAIDWIVASLPLAVATIMSIRFVGVATGIDMPRHLGGVLTRDRLSPSSSWLGLVDRGNLLMLMLPLAIPAFVAARAAGRWPRGRAAALLIALVAPWLVLGVVTTPGQGVFRDLDFYAPGFMAGAVLCAWLLAHALDDTRQDPFAAGATLVGITSTLALLACFHDPRSGLSRVRAYLDGPPLRSETARALGWDFLALRSMAIRDWALAAPACEQAARLGPSPRLLIMLGIARTYTNDLAGARAAYEQVLARTPNEPLAWAGLAGIAERLGQPALADSARLQMRLHARDGSRAGAVRELMEEYPEYGPRRDDGR